jgi:hypothetical protein
MRWEVFMLSDDPRCATAAGGDWGAAPAAGGDDWGGAGDAAPAAADAGWGGGETPAESSDW